MYVISACLCGVNCKYSGGNNFNENIFEIFQRGEGILICPEQIGGLPTPRIPCEIVGGKAENVFEGNAEVISKDGNQCTKEFIKGAKESLEIAKAVGAKKAILKSNSPSCGSGSVYNGQFNDKLIKGDGVTAYLFKSNGIAVETEEEYK